MRDFSKMTNRELEDYAESMGIRGVRRKSRAFILQKIVCAERGDEVLAPPVDSNPITCVGATLLTMVTGYDQEGNRNTNTLVSVSCGANNDFFPVVGHKAGEVMALLKDAMNISNDPQIIVNGMPTNGNYTLQAGDRLEFVKHSGVKG